MNHSKNLRPKRFVTTFCAFLSWTTINQTHPLFIILYQAILICKTHMFIISRNGCFSLDCILNILKLTYLSKRLTSDVVRRDCRSFCTPRSRSFCCRSTAPSSVLHTRLDTQYVAAICNLTLSFIIYCISLFSKLSSPITNSLAVEPLAMLAITHRACGSKGTSKTVQSPGGGGGVF